MAKKPNSVYLDNNATTELSQDVATALVDLIVNDIYGNPSSQHWVGQRIKALLDTSRRSVSRSLGCAPEEVVFTSGGTEANSIALRGVYSYQDGGDNDAVTSAAEHSSVRNTLKEIVPEENLRMIPLLPDGSLDMRWADRLITEDTSLVSVMLANNETGALFDVETLTKIAHSKGALVHCDAIQAYGKVPVNVKDLGVDLLSISGHKAHALPGIGALYVRKGLIIHPSQRGGGQEQGIRSGTENYVGATSMGIVADEISEGAYCGSDARNIFERALYAQLPNIKVNASAVKRLPNTSSVTFDGIYATTLVEALNERGIAASAGSACASGSSQPSPVLKGMGMTDESSLSTVRFSFSRFTTMDQVFYAVLAVTESVRALRNTTFVK